VRPHVIRRRPAAAIAQAGRTQSLRAVIARGVRVRFSTTGRSMIVRGTLRMGGRTLARGRVRANGRGVSTIVFRLSRVQRRELRRRRRVVLHVVLTAANANPATATIVVRPAGARAP
jgi:hypothetical protein